MWARGSWKIIDDAAGANRAQRPRRLGQQIQPVEHHLAPGAGAARQQPEDRAGRHRLAAPRLADETDDLSSVDGEADVAHDGVVLPADQQLGRDTRSSSRGRRRPQTRAAAPSSRSAGAP